MHVFGLFAIVPASVLLTISFFVLVVAKKSDSEGLKKFGQVVAVVLWVAALAVFSLGLCIFSNCRPPIEAMRHHGMWQHERCYNNDENEEGEGADEYEIKKGVGPCDTMKGLPPSQEQEKENKKDKPKK